MEIIDFALKQNTVVFRGALTPADVMTAWKAGSDFVKVFLCAPLGGWRVEVSAGNMLSGNLQEVTSGIHHGDKVIANALVFQNTVEQK